MPTLLIERDSEDKPIRRCPFHKGLAGFANIGGKFCIHDCDCYEGINPQTDQLYCKESV